MRRALRSLAVSAAFAVAGAGFAVAAGPLQFWPHEGGALNCASRPASTGVLFGDNFTAPNVPVTITDVHLSSSDGMVLEDAWAASYAESAIGTADYSAEWDSRPRAAGLELQPGEQVNVVGLLRRQTDDVARSGPMVVDYTIWGIPFTETLGIRMVLADDCEVVDL